MNNEKKLTAQDLALYYRGQAKLIRRAKKLDSFHGFAHVGQVVVIDSVLIASVEQGLYVVKPIIRQLSDMTEPEEMEVQNMVDQMGVGYSATHGAQITLFLLSRHFDLFGWIESGLAIDKTKIETK